MTPRHEAALAYARAGVPIFPCVPDGTLNDKGEPSKAPATKNSFADATTDLDQINRWWARADYNIGLEPGRIDQFVIDIDPRHGGDETWAKLITALHDVPTVRVIQTWSGGRHLYFAGHQPPGVKQFPRFGEGLDVRGDNSYVLVPPSCLGGVCYRRIS